MVFFVAAICSLKFSLIASAIVDVVEYVLDLQVLCRLLVMLALLRLVLVTRI